MRGWGTLPEQTGFATNLARNRARGLLTLTRQRPPVDVQAIIDLAGIPIVERRWVLAEELGHVLMGHRLVESTEPGKPSIGLLEPRRVFYEREARAFAAELLMPFGEVRRRWFGLSAQGAGVEGMVRRLEDEFSVTAAAMRIRLQQMKLISA